MPSFTFASCEKWEYHAPLLFLHFLLIYLKHDFLLLLLQAEQVIRQAAPAAPVSNAACSKLLQRVNESKYSAWPPSYQTVRLGQTIGFKELSQKSERTKRYRLPILGHWKAKSQTFWHSALSIWSFQVDIRQPNSTNNVSFLFCLKELVDGKGAER